LPKEEKAGKKGRGLIFREPREKGGVHNTFPSRTRRADNSAMITRSTNKRKKKRMGESPQLSEKKAKSCLYGPKMTDRGGRKKESMTGPETVPASDFGHGGGDAIAQFQKWYDLHACCKLFVRLPIVPRVRERGVGSQWGEGRIDP